MDGWRGGQTFYLYKRFVVAHLHEAAEEDGHVFDVAWREDFGVLQQASVSRSFSRIIRSILLEIGLEK
jgi:hypothetical protein